MSFMKKSFSVLSLILLSGCAGTPGNNDPYQKFNRNSFEFNLEIDRNVLKPVANAYKSVTHDAVRESVSNFLFNIKEPFYMVNYVLSGDVDNALTSLFRFFINSTFGLLGLVDASSHFGVQRRETSHHETLTKLKFENGDFIMLPILGSSSTRDAVTEPVSWFADPVGYFIGFPWMLGKAVLSAVNTRAENGEFIDKSLKDVADPYSTVKSLYFQKYGVKTEAEKKKEHDEEMAALQDDDE